MKREESAKGKAKAMTKAAVRRAMLRLPVTDRIDLLDDLNISIHRDQADIPVYPWQKKLIDEAMAEYEANPKTVMTHAQFKAKLRAEIRRMRRRT